MEEGSGPTGLRRDPTAQTLREIGAFACPTRRSGPQLFRIIIPETTAPPLSFDRYGTRRSLGVTVSACRLPSVTMNFEDSGLYRDITDFAHDTPMWVQHGAGVWTEAGLLVFVALFAIAWWRARRDTPHAFAIAALAPLATAVAYVCSEVLKSAVTEERPCRAVAGVAASLAECPPRGDWSFPSNHATIAGTAAVALALVRRALLWLTAPLALLMAFSRVFVGVHYPHDVVAGLGLGTLVALIAVRLGTGPATRLARAMRTSSAPAVRWFTGPGTAPVTSYGSHARR